MAIVKTRPFAVASEASVDLNVNLVEPPVELEELVGKWEPGQDVTVGVQARLRPEFWTETGIDTSEPVRLTVTATCFSARAAWIESAYFQEGADGWTATTAVTIDGAVSGEQAIVEAVVSGPGRTKSEDVRFAIHDHAKLWESTPVRVPLEEVSGFPTSAISFEVAERYQVPWMVEVSEGAEATQSYSTAVRLYLNTDLDVGMKIIKTEAPDETFMMIETEIQFAVLHALWRTANDWTENELIEIAKENSDSLAALGLQYASNLGTSFKEAMRLAHEEPLKLLAIARERQRFMGKKARKA